MQTLTALVRSLTKVPAPDLSGSSSGGGGSGGGGGSSGAALTTAALEPVVAFMDGVPLAEVQDALLRHVGPGDVDTRSSGTATTGSGGGAGAPHAPALPAWVDPSAPLVDLARSLFLSCRAPGAKAARRRTAVFRGLVERLNSAAAGRPSSRCATDCVVLLLAEADALATADLPPIIEAALASACGEEGREDAGDAAVGIVEGPVEGHALDLLPKLLALLPDDFLLSTTESNSVLAGGWHVPCVWCLYPMPRFWRVCRGGWCGRPPARRQCWWWWCCCCCCCCRCWCWCWWCVFGLECFFGLCTPASSGACV
jgi:hypothetical protein